MSDSDSDCLSSAVNNVFGFSNESTMVRVKGPQIDRTQLMNGISDPFLMPSLERQRLPSRSIQPYQSFNAYQSSMIGARAPSPTRSVHSSFRGFGQSSMIGRRAPSPTHSMCSNMSVSESIVQALKSGKFNKNELRSISETVNKLTKGRIRKRMAKRRHRRLFMKGSRRNSDYDSGEVGSDTSISSDENRSTRTGTTAFKGHSRMGQMNGSLYTNSRGGRTSDDARSIQTDVNELRRTIKDKTMFRDCTDHLKQDSFRNIFQIGPGKYNSAISTKPPNITVQNNGQKDRFKNSFLLPSQRFAQSKPLFPVPEKCVINPNPLEISREPSIPSRTACKTPDIEQNYKPSEETDPENSILKHPETHRKRNLNSPDYSETKKTKLSSPKTATDKVIATSKPAAISNIGETSNDFVFVKPQMPLRKLSNVKRIEDIAIPQPKNVVNHDVPVYKPLSPIQKPSQERNSLDEQSETMQTSSEVSMRPSFMKRKLFTQTLDVTENKNSAESSPSVSPAKGYSEMPKEKNKARKLVISQSCLSRDIPNDENNLLDLIHKIIPKERMNVTTNLTQKKEIPQSTEATIKNTKNDKENAADEWDITAMLSNCKTNDVHSDTFTDEDIFVVHEKKDAKKQSKQKKEITKSTSITGNTCGETQVKVNESEPKTTKKVTPAKGKLDEPKKTVYNYAHAFWNCDSESEGPTTPRVQNVENKNGLIKQTKNATEKKNSLVVKNIKSVLEVTASSNDSNMSLEDVGHNIHALTNNRSLRVKAAKVLKEKRMNSPKPYQRENLQKTICDKLSFKGKSTSKQASSPDKNSPSKKQIKNKENHSDKARDKQINKDDMNKKSKPITVNKTIASLFNKDESESPHLDFTKRKRGRPKKVVNAANSTASSLQPASTTLQDNDVSPNTNRRTRPRKICSAAKVTECSTSLQDKTVSPKTYKRKRDLPRKVADTSINTVSEPSPQSKPTKLTTVKAAEKSTVKNKLTRTRILETPKNSKIEQSSKLKATINKKADKNTKTNQTKATNHDDKKQDRHKTDESMLRKEIKACNVLVSKTDFNKLQHKKAKKNIDTAPDKKVLRNANLDDYICRRTRSSGEKSFLSQGRAKSPLSKNNGKVLQKNDSLKPTKSTAVASKIAENGLSSDKENTSHISTCEKSRRVRKSTFRCCEKEATSRNKSCDYLKPNGVAGQQTNTRSKPPEVAKKRSMPFVRSLGIATATIGLMTRHCTAEESFLNTSVIDDDCHSITARSISSSIISRGARSKFVHVW